MIPRRWLGVGALLALLTFLAVYPLGMLLYGSLHSTPPGMPGEFNLDGYRQLFTAQSGLVLWNSIAIAFTKTVLSLALAVFFAWVIARTDTPMRGTLEVLITLPFFIPPILTATAWGMLGNPEVGTINLAWKWLTGGTTPLVNVFSWGGVVWHMMQYSVPFLFLLLVDAFRAMDPALEEASRMSGAGRVQTFRRVTFMLMLPMLTSAFILSFIRGVESFESPVIFGTPAGIEVLTTRIYQLIAQQAQPNYQAATALGFVCVALMLILVALRWHLLGGRSFATITGKGYSPRVMRLGPLRWVTFAACVTFFLLTVLLPVGQLILSSFFKFFGFYQRDMFTFDHYRAVWNNRDFWEALGNTLLLGVVGATATMVLGSLAAYVTVRTRWKGRRLVEVLTWLPWTMPGIVLGLGFLWGFVILPGWIPIYGTINALLLAYIALGTPVAVRVMAGAYGQLGQDIEESSRVHGANFWQTLWRILVALAWPSFAVGWILLFFGILRELSASILLYSANTKVLSVVMLQMWAGGSPEEVSVIALILLALVFVFRWAEFRILRRQVRA